MRNNAWIAGLLCLCVAWSAGAAAAAPELVVIDQDGSGPGGSNQRAMMVLLQSPKARVLGITMVTGNAWMTTETAHTLRMLELLGRTDVPVYKGATFPLVRDRAQTIAAQRFGGKVAWLGAWGGGESTPSKITQDPYALDDMPEGKPQIKAHAGNAAQFLIDTVHAHPGQVTIVAAGPLTNLALAQRMDPSFAKTAKALVLMGGSISPVTDDAEFTTTPSHEFNFWFDPEAAHIVLSAPWQAITVTPVDVSLQTWYSDDMQKAIARSHSPAAQYLAKYDTERYYMWDEIAALAWLQPDLIDKTRTLYLDTDMSHGPSYGNTLAWTDKSKPANAGTPATVQMTLHRKAFDKALINLMKAQPAPSSNQAKPEPAHEPQ